MQVSRSVLNLQTKRRTDHLFLERTQARGVSNVVNFGWQKADGCVLGDLFPEHQIYSEHNVDSWDFGTVIIETPHVVACVTTSGKHVLGQVAGEKGQAEIFVEAIQAQMPRAEPDQNTVQFRFWYGSAMGGSHSRPHLIEISSWSDIKGNYPSSVARELEDMMGWERPTRPGQLILWQGQPGTGKTTALRALASAWRDWCSFHLVLDPDRMFSEAEYLYEVALDHDSSDKWRALVLEDTGELLAADARMQTGHALSRLLNLVDGIVGQGLNLMVLVTTNEELGSLHPAVARPGRCAARIEFQPFPSEEASSWFSSKGICVPEHPPRVLAEMFGALDGDNRQTELAFGFGR